MQEAEKIIDVVEQFQIDEILFCRYTKMRKMRCGKCRRSVAEASKIEFHL